MNISWKFTNKLILLFQNIRVDNLDGSMNVLRRNEDAISGLLLIVRNNNSISGIVSAFNGETNAGQLRTWINQYFVSGRDGWYDSYRLFQTFVLWILELTLLLFTLDIIVVRVDSNIYTTITFENVAVEINPDSFQSLLNSYLF